MRRLCALFFLFFYILSSSLSAMPILGAPTAGVDDAKEWARKRNATETFIMLADIYWEKATALGINPVVAYCQAAIETGYGRFGGIIDASFNNPCGIKAFHRDGDGKDDHKRFDSWEDGVDAHLDHLALYIGIDGYPKEETKDPRHHAYLKGVAQTVTQMGSRWAMSPTYSKRLMQLIKSLEK